MPAERGLEALLLSPMVKGSPSGLHIHIKVSRAPCLTGR